MPIKVTMAVQGYACSKCGVEDTSEAVITNHETNHCNDDCRACMEPEKYDDHICKGGFGGRQP